MYILKNVLTIVVIWTTFLSWFDWFNNLVRAQPLNSPEPLCRCIKFCSGRGHNTQTQPWHNPPTPQTLLDTFKYTPVVKRFPTARGWFEKIFSPGSSPKWVWEEVATKPANEWPKICQRDVWFFIRNGTFGSAVSVTSLSILMRGSV